MYRPKLVPIRVFANLSDAQFRWLNGQTNNKSEYLRTLVGRAMEVDRNQQEVPDYASRILSDISVLAEQNRLLLELIQAVRTEHQIVVEAATDGQHIDLKEVASVAERSASAALAGFRHRQINRAETENSIVTSNGRK